MAETKEETALRRAGDLAFIHGEEDGSVATTLWRVVYLRGFGEKQLRCTQFFTTEKAAEQRVSRLDADPKATVVNFGCYRIATTPDTNPPPSPADPEKRDVH